MLRPLRALLALVLVAFALTGCMKIDMDLTINGDNDTISGSMIFAMDKQVLTMGGKSPEDSFKENADDLGDDLPKGSRTEVYDDGKYYGQKIIFDEVPFSEFRSNDEGPVIVHEDGRYTFTMDADMSAGEFGEDAELLAPMLSTIEFKIAVTFPGEVVETDKHAEIDGQTVTWVLKMNDSYDLRAVSEEGGSFPWWLLAGVAALFGLLVVVGIVVLIMRLNRRPGQVPPADAAPGTGPAAGITTPTAPYPTVGGQPESPDQPATHGH